MFRDDSDDIEDTYMTFATLQRRVQRLTTEVDASGLPVPELLYALFHDVRRRDAIVALAYVLDAIKNMEPPAALETVVDACFCGGDWRNNMRIVCEASLCADCAPVFHMLLDPLHRCAGVVSGDEAWTFTWRTKFVHTAIAALVTDPGLKVPHIILHQVFMPLPMGPPSTALQALLRVCVDEEICSRIIESRNNTVIAMLVNWLRAVPEHPLHNGPVTRAVHELDSSGFGILDADGDYVHVMQLHEVVLPLMHVLGYLPPFDDGGTAPWDAVLASDIFLRHFLQHMIQLSSCSMDIAAQVWSRLPSHSRTVFMSDLVRHMIVENADETTGFLVRISQFTACMRDRADTVTSANAADAFVASVTVALCIAVACDASATSFKNRHHRMLHRLMPSRRVVENVLALDSAALMLKRDGVELAILVAKRMSKCNYFLINVAEDCDGALEALIDGLDLTDALGRLPSPTPLLQKHIQFGGLRRAWITACVQQPVHSTILHKKRCL
jgi:hypothetical protein